MIHIKSLISQIFKNKKKLDNKLIHQKVKEIIKNNTPNAEVLFYKNNNLIIKCSNNITANELRLQQELIRNKINKSLKKEVVKKIIIKIQ